MDVFEILDVVRKKPGFYLDQSSLLFLRTFLSGFETGVRSCGHEPSVLGQLRPFSIWVSKKLGFKGYSGGWCNMIRDKCDSEEQAFNRFFELLDEYKRERPQNDLLQR